MHLDYRTVWVDAEGLLQIRDDIYRRDKLPAKVVFAQSIAAARRDFRFVAGASTKSGE